MASRLVGGATALRRSSSRLINIQASKFRRTLYSSSSSSTTTTSTSGSWSNKKLAFVHGLEYESVKLTLGLGGMAAVLLFMMQDPEGGTSTTCASSKVRHALYVTGSDSKAHVKAVQPPAVAQEVVIPGEPGVIDSVAFGPDYLVVAKQGNMYLFGPLNAPPTLLAPPPRGWFSGSDTVVQLASSQDTIYGRTAKGRVWKWTRNPDNGDNKEALSFDGPRAVLLQQTVDHISAGLQHAAFVTRKGEVFTMGENPDGRLGIGSVGSKLEEPAKVQGLPEDIKIVKASCGNNHTLLLDSKGGAYSFGADQWYQLAQGETWKVTKDRDEAMITEAKKIRQFEEVKVADIAAGGNHSLFAVEYQGFVITKGKFDVKIKTPAFYKEVWSTGYGQYGQLGDKMYAHISLPRQIKDLRLITEPHVTLPIAQLACGDNHSAAIVIQPAPTPSQQKQEGSGESKYVPSLYVFGMNLGNQCGTGRAGNVAKPTQPQGINQARVQSVVCGFDRTGIIVTMT